MDENNKEKANKQTSFEDKIMPAILVLGALTVTALTIGLGRFCYTIYMTFVVNYR